MRFQKYLKRNILKEYRYFYLDYELLRSIIKPGFTQPEENAFIVLLEENLKRVFDFVKSKHIELNRRIEKFSKKACKSKLNLKIKDLSEDMKNFSEFIRINVVGFKKILSRHDKKTGFKLMSKYKPLLKEKIKGLESLDDLIYNSSKILLKNTKVKKASESNSTFIRRTDKYWVHSENIGALKFYILQHLPIFVFSKNNGGSPYAAWDHRSHDTRVSSVYLDNTSFDLYTDRLNKLHHSEAIRIRWYGSEVPEMVFVERKKHEDGWTGETSKKLRFKIHERYVVDFLNGKDVFEDVKLVNEDDVEILYREIQNSVVTKNLRPIVRTYYKRVAFQLPNDSRVRLSLDTELCMIKECPDDDFLCPRYPLTSWRREDVCKQFPFPTLSKSEIVRFPHAILEVKTQSVDESKPKWIEELISGPLVEHVHKFSKYIHGCAVLYPTIENIPYWLPQMTTNIRKDPWDSEDVYKEFNDQVLIEIPPQKEEMINSEHLSPIDTHGKKIAIPVRVEPKVFFANERTFLSWVQFSIFLGGIGTAMLGMGDRNATFSGIILILVSVIFSFYALYLYLWRAGMIRKRHPGPYDDIYGPPVLVVVFLLAMFFSIIYKFPLKRVL